MKTKEVFIPGEMAFVLQTATGEHKTFAPGLQKVENEYVDTLKAKIKKMFPDAVLPDGAIASEQTEPDTIESLRARLAQMEAAEAAQAETAQETKPTAPAIGAPSGNQSDERDDSDAASLVTETVWEKLRGAGLEDANAVKAASDDTLLAISGIGPKLLRAIRKVVV